jgi:hypothetical protein
VVSVMLQTEGLNETGGGASRRGALAFLQAAWALARSIE